MKAYQIKVTELSGRDVGHSYILRKGGYGVSENQTQWIDDCYQSERAAKMACSKYAKRNEIEHQLEAQRRERNEKDGKANTEWWICPICKYEPVEVECYESLEKLLNMEYGITNAE